MSRTERILKRKAITRDAPESNEAALFDELGNNLNGITRNAHDSSDSDLEADEDASIGSSDLEDDDEQDYDESDEEGGIKRLNGTTNYRVVEDANGNPRYVYNEIDPVYDSDDSEAPQTENTIGNIPLSFYDSYPHIGYDINGKKVMRPAKGSALDSLLDSIDIPEGWTGLTDPATGKPLELSAEELDVLKRLTRNELPEDGYDPYPEMVEYFTGTVEPMPLSSAPEPKRRFVPSKHEHKRVMKMVKAIKEGRIQPYKPPTEQDEQADEPEVNYDIWADAAPRPDHPMNVPAPKLPPPGYEESYHPPPEYIPDEEELRKWNETDEEDREKPFLPKDHTALRKVAGYDQFLKEKFERCLDLYLAPRIRRNKLNIDPESLLPKLPSLEDLRPYPSSCDKVFRCPDGRVHSVAIDPSGNFLATGGSDGHVRIWTLADGKIVWQQRLSDDEAVNVVRWRPGEQSLVLAAAAGEYLFLIVPQGLLEPDDELITSGKDAIESGFSAQQSAAPSDGKEPIAKWARPTAKQRQAGVLVQVALRSNIKQIAWHRRGGHLATVAPRGGRRAIAIHTLQKHQTQLPFRRLKGLAQAVQFHPLKPILFVATQRLIRSYDLAKQVPLKTLQPGARWISGFDVHPGGENLVVSAYDRRLLWMDTELSDKPYRVLRYHEKAVRAARYHQGGWPLFADASDDGTVQIFHGKVVGDLMQNATIVPIKKLLGHDVKSSLGVLDLDWHPTEPWVVSAGADGTCRLWK